MKQRKTGWARFLRRRATYAEQVLWDVVRKRRLGGYKFRRQFVIDRCCVDFCCLSRRLVVEVDGPYHGTPKQRRRDRARDAFLRSQGFRVLRVTNRAVVCRTGRVKRFLLEHLEAPIDFEQP